ncbi:HtaA domain-containing protein [Streptomyces sp. NBC_01361]|uniref:HtaA domain-containing protein n=1 Tax=Streptomyces sp. NBC_01361 TaxID=2903838 RepID=UPI002E30D448|nr:HtaA domain-containing protein [Streptomyces sp. NBC_01361]
MAITRHPLALAAAIAVALGATALTPPVALAADGTAGTGGSAKAAAPVLELKDDTLDWGVKESFRTYITGPVAHGKVELSGGAAKNGSVYRFGDASGSYDAGTKTLDAAFKGAVRFLGHETNGVYALDLKFSDLHVTAEGERGELVADVSSKDQKTGKVTQYDHLTVPSLALGSGDPTAKGDVVALDAVPATLTSGGAKAFGGFYEAGAALDDVTATVSLDENAELPSTSGGSGTGSGTGTTSSTGSSAAGTTGSTGSLAQTGAGVPAGPPATMAALVVAAGAGTVLAVRKRRGDGERTA